MILRLTSGIYFVLLYIMYMNVFKILTIISNGMTIKARFMSQDVRLMGKSFTSVSRRSYRAWHGRSGRSAGWTCFERITQSDWDLGEIPKARSTFLALFHVGHAVPGLFLLCEGCTVLLRGASAIRELCSHEWVCNIHIEKERYNHHYF